MLDITGTTQVAVLVGGVVDVEAGFAVDAHGKTVVVLDGAT